MEICEPEPERPVSPSLEEALGEGNDLQPPAPERSLAELVAEFMNWAESRVTVGVLCTTRSHEYVYAANSANVSPLFIYIISGIVRKNDFSAHMMEALLSPDRNARQCLDGKWTAAHVEMTRSKARAIMRAAQREDRECFVAFHSDKTVLQSYCHCPDAEKPHNKMYALHALLESAASVQYESADRIVAAFSMQPHQDGQWMRRFSEAMRDFQRRV